MEIAGRLAVVTGGGSGMGRELVLQLATAGCDVATCDVHDTEPRRDGAARARGRHPTPASPRTAATCRTKRRCVRFRDEVVAQHAREHVQPAVQQRRRRRWLQLRERRPRRSGTARSRSAGAASTTAAARSCRSCRERRGVHRQHQQRERLLGRARTRCPAHRLQHGQVRGEGLLRVAHHRPPAQRAAREGGRRDARTRRHRHRGEHHGVLDRRSRGRSRCASSPTGSARRRRCRRAKRRRSSSTACATTSGASSSATTRGRSTTRCGPTRWRSTAATVSRCAASRVERIEHPGAVVPARRCRRTRAR